jgi:hypothetical protein
MHTRAAAGLREALNDALGHRPILKNPVRDFERLAIGERARLLEMVNWLLREWPHRFVTVCRNKRIYSSVLLRDFRNPPYWYWNVVREHLFVVYTPWRSGFDGGPNSYATLTRSAAAPSARIAAQRKRVEFVRQQRHLWKSQRRLAQALSSSGLYSRKVHFTQIMKVCPKLVAICRGSSRTSRT